jgi:hypothetical protein
LKIENGPEKSVSHPFSERVEGENPHFQVEEPNLHPYTSTRPSSRYGSPHKKVESLTVVYWVGVYI